MIVSGLMANCSAPVHHSFCKVGFSIRRYEGTKMSDHKNLHLYSSRIPKVRIQHSRAKFGTKFAMSEGRNHHQLRFDDDIPQEPFWISWTTEAVRSLKSLFWFLAEQPSQLKYIEWPSFQSTLRTATLTLVLVVLLIVALSSVDSALSYLLVLLLRPTP